MFAPFNSARRTEQPDIGFGVLGWLVKFDPPNLDLKILRKTQNHDYQVEYSQKPLKNLKKTKPRPLITSLSIESWLSHRLCQNFITQGEYLPLAMSPRWMRMSSLYGWFPIDPTHIMPLIWPLCIQLFTSHTFTEQTNQPLTCTDYFQIHE